MSKTNSYSIHHLILLIILIFGAYFRFYNYQYRVTYDKDSSRDAFVALEGARSFQLPLTGPFISIAPITTGPWYWYQLIIARLLFPNIYMPWLYLGILSMLTIYLMYKIGILLDSPLLGLILAYVTALAPQQIYTAKLLINPSIIGCFSALAILLWLEIIIKNRSVKWAWYLGFSIGVTINTHYQAAPLLIFILYLLFLGKKKHFVAALYGLLITFIPLLIFELTNHWYNSRHLLQYLRFDQYKVWVSTRWLTYITDYWPTFWSYAAGGTKLFSLAVFIFSIISYFYHLLNNSHKKIHLLIFLSFILNVVIIRYYRGEKFFGYLQFFHPYLFIFVGYLLLFFWKTRLKFIAGILAVIIYSCFVAPYSLRAMSHEGLTVDTQNLYKQIISKWGDHRYVLYDCIGRDIEKDNALGLYLYLKNKIDTTSQYKLLFNYGNCLLPLVVRGNKIIDPNDKSKDVKIYDNIFLIYNVSEASEGALLNAGWTPLTARREYQSAARWWLDEKP